MELGPLNIVIAEVRTPGPVETDPDRLVTTGAIQLSDAELLILETVPLEDHEVQIFEEFESCTVGGASRIRISHHEAAKLLATGHSALEVSALTGYSPGTIYALRRSPAFIELMNHYQSMRTKEVLDLASRMKMAAQDGVERVHEMMHEEGATPAFVLKATTELLDRIGQGATSKLEVKGLHIHAISELKERSREPSVLDRNTYLQHRETALEGGAPALLGPRNSEPALGPHEPESGSESSGAEVREEAGKRAVA